jgi:hypothetical protein
MEVLFLHLLKRIEEAWHRPAMGVLGFLAAAALGSYEFVYLPTTPATWVSWIIAAVFPLAFAVAWGLSNRVPRVRRHRVGVVLSIFAENDAQERRVRREFIDRLNDLLAEDRAQTRIEFVVYPRWLAERITSTELVTAYAKRSRASFMVFGNVQEGTHGGTPYHFLSLRGLITHRDTDSRLKNELITDFNQVLPARKFLPKDSDVLHFETASRELEFCTRYIIGIAATISGDAVYAERMLLAARDRLPARVAKNPGLRATTRRLPKWLATLYQSWLQHLTAVHMLKRGMDAVEKADEIADKLLALQPNNPTAHIAKAVCDFLLRRDIESARRHARLGTSGSDSTWRFSVAFLYAYEGKLSRARVEYVHAFNGIYDRTVPTQCEEFIQLVLAEEPSQIQLRFCSGLLNHFAKHDPASAVEDFRVFLDAEESRRWPDERAAAKKYMEQAMTALVGQTIDDDPEPTLSSGLLP